MMEEITIDEKNLIVIINNIKGNINRLNIVLEKILKSANIDYLILTGEVFTLKTKEEDILSISFKGSIIIFDSSQLGEIIKSKYEYNNYMLNDNILFLGRSGIFSPKESSINFAYLSGIEAKEFLEKNSSIIGLPYTNKYYKYKDIENLINKYIDLNNSKNKKIDFFLINSFPQSLYLKYFNSIKEKSVNDNIKLNEEQINSSISYSLNYLLYIMNPRYIISSVDDFFYKNTKENVLNGAGYRTFFYNLGYFEDKKNINENFCTALDYKSINDMNDLEILSLDQYYEEEIGNKLIKDNNLFKYFNNFIFDNNKSLIQNFDDYLQLCFKENKMKCLKETKQESKPLYLSNFSYNCTEENIKNYLINRYGSIKNIKFLVNKDTNKFNGKVIVQFNDINSMNNMLNNSNKEKFNDRFIKAVIYTPKDQLNNNNINIKNNINNDNKNVGSNNSINTTSNNNSFNNTSNNNSFNNTSNNNSFYNTTNNNSFSHTSNNKSNFNNSMNNPNKITNNNNNVINSNNNGNDKNNNNNNNITIKNDINNNKNKDCWFCYGTNENLDKRFILEEFNHFYLSFSKGPINQFHFLIIPKRHVSFYIELSDEEKFEFETMIQILKNFLFTKKFELIIFEKNLKYNFSQSIHLLINVVGFDISFLSKLNEFTENFLIEEKLYKYIVIYNDINIYLYSYDQNDEYIYINIPKIYKNKILRKIFLLKTNEYKIDYPRKLICNLINKEDRINWRNTMSLGEEFLEDIKKDVKNFINNIFLKEK